MKRKWFFHEHKYTFLVFSQSVTVTTTYYYNTDYVRNGYTCMYGPIEHYNNTFSRGVYNNYDTI